MSIFGGSFSEIVKSPYRPFVWLVTELGVEAGQNVEKRALGTVSARSAL